MELFAPHANGTEVLVASRYTHSAVYEITSQGDPYLPDRPVQANHASWVCSDDFRVGEA